MKTLQALTTCLLLFISITTNAQEKQNDASWEETVEFLSKNLHYISIGNVDKERYPELSRSTTKWRRSVAYFTENNREIVIEFVPRKDSDRFCGDKSYQHFIQYTIPLDKIINVSSHYFFWIQTTGKYIDVKKHLPVKSGSTCTITDAYTTTDVLQVRVEDSEMRPRLYKAFEHLAYLAKEKREAKRKASGDKF